MSGSFVEMLPAMRLLLSWCKAAPPSAKRPPPPKPDVATPSVAVLPLIVQLRMFSVALPRGVEADCAVFVVQRGTPAEDDPTAAEPGVAAEGGVLYSLSAFDVVTA